MLQKNKLFEKVQEAIRDSGQGRSQSVNYHVSFKKGKIGRIGGDTIFGPQTINVAKKRKRQPAHAVFEEKETVAATAHADPVQTLDDASFTALAEDDVENLDPADLRLAAHPVLENYTRRIQERIKHPQERVAQQARHQLQLLEWGVLDSSSTALAEEYRSNTWVPSDIILDMRQIKKLSDDT